MLGKYLVRGISRPTFPLRADAFTQVYPLPKERSESPVILKSLGLKFTRRMCNKSLSCEPENVKKIFHIT